MQSIRLPIFGASLAALCALASPALAQQKWEPNKPIEIIVNAGAGGATDQLARTIQAVCAKHNLTTQPFIVTIKPGAGGAEGMMDAKNSKGDATKLFIGNTGLYALPLATKLPFNWRDLTPVAVIAMDEFCLWVNAEAPYKTPKEYLDAVKAAGPNSIKMGGTAALREDQILTAMIDAKAGTKFAYIPYKSGAEAAVQLVGKHIDSNVNNPSENVSQWKAGQVRPLCIFDKERSEYKEKITATQAWSDIPTAKELGFDIDYLMLRGIFLPGGCTPEQTAYYVDLLKKVVGTPEWKDYMSQNALKSVFLSGKEFTDFLAKDEAMHKEIMTTAGFTSGQN
jgi:putative tricarboxylic transport membrane protein